jgi:hypothetical protein
MPASSARVRARFVRSSATPAFPPEKALSSGGKRLKMISSRLIQMAPANTPVRHGDTSTNVCHFLESFLSVCTARHCSTSIFPGIYVLYLRLQQLILITTVKFRNVELTLVFRTFHLPNLFRTFQFLHESSFGFQKIPFFL